MIRAFLKKVGLFAKKDPIIIPPQKHRLSRANISKNALKVLNRLHQKGFGAYLVGGGVRDVLLGLHPKDFDVVTNAKPEEVKSIFRNCRLIGRRFRLAHVYFGPDIVEVATFRGKLAEANADWLHSEEGMILRDNVYGTMEEDVWRRDFTVNALYYNIADFSLVDYVGGMADLKAKRLKMIGDPVRRFREDPVRMLRAIRFACKAQFTLSKEIKDAILSSKELITNVAPPRLFEEILKMFHSGAAREAYTLLKQKGLFAALFPDTAECLAQSRYPADHFLNCIFENTDQRIKQDKSVNPAFVMAALLWHPICIRADQLGQKGMALFSARNQAIEEMLSRQIKKISFPKRMTQTAREIWMFQLRLEKRQIRRLEEMITSPRFRAAYDFLELRAKSGEPVLEIATWWKTYMEGDASIRQSLMEKMKSRRPRTQRSRHQEKRS